MEKHHFIEEKDENFYFNPLDASDKTSDILISPFHLLKGSLVSFLGSLIFRRALDAEMILIRSHFVLVV